MRTADECRWRGGFCIATSAVVAVFWLASWLVDEPMRPGITALAAAAAAAPTLLVAGAGSARRVQDALARTLPPPRASVHETVAAARDRRMRLAGAVLTGIVLLLIFERFTGGEGVVAGLLIGLLAAFGAVDLVDARRWQAAERARESRIYTLMTPDALTPRLGVGQVYETPRGDRRGRAVEPSPFDLGI